MPVWILAALLLPLTMAATAVAAPAPEPAPASVGRDNELVTIQRPIRDIAVDAGSSSVQEITVQNQTARPVLVELAPRDLALRREGSAVLAIAAAGSQPRGAGAWLEARRAQVRIEPFDEATLLVDVDVPATAGPGAWGGAMLLTVSGAGAESMVSLQQETSVNFLFAVSGEAERLVGVSVTAPQRVLWSGGTTTWDVVVSNDGDSFESFGGRLVVDAGVGGARTYALKGGILFPGEQRRQRIRADVRPSPDYIRGSVEVTTRGRDGSGEPAQDLEYEASAGVVLVIPWWLPVVLIVAILIVFLRVRARQRVDHEAIDESIEQYEQ